MHETLCSKSSLIRIQSIDDAHCLQYHVPVCIFSIYVLFSGILSQYISRFLTNYYFHHRIYDTTEWLLDSKTSWSLRNHSS